MNVGVEYPHISTDERGTVRIGRTRYKVLHLAAEHYHSKRSRGLRERIEAASQ